MLIFLPPRCGEYLTSHDYDIDIFFCFLTHNDNLEKLRSDDERCVYILFLYSIFIVLDHKLCNMSNICSLVRCRQNLIFKDFLFYSAQVS